MENVQASPSSLPSNRIRRRILPIVDARFQWKYTLIIMALGVGLTAVMGGFLYKAHKDNTRLLDLTENPTLQAEVIRSDSIFLLYLIVLVALMGIMLGLWGLVVTHRVSGPLHVVARYLSILASGTYPDLRPLRKRDELHDFFAAFEEAVKAMRDRDVSTLRDLEHALNDAKKGGDAKAALDGVVRIIERQRDALADSLRGEPE